MSNHSVIEHRANYHFLKLEEDYIEICSSGTQYPHCKAFILSVLEHWMNDKIGKGQDGYVYMSYPQWIEAMYGLFRRNHIINCLTELLEEKLIVKRPYHYQGKDSFAYCLNVPEVQKRLAELPERTAKYTRPKVNAFKFKRVEKQTDVNLNGTTHPNLNASEGDDPFKFKHNIDTITETPSNIDSSDTDASAIAPAAPASFSQQQEQAEPIRIATSEQEKREQDVDEHENHSHETVAQENMVGPALSDRADAVPADAQKTPPKPQASPPVLKEAALALAGEQKAAKRVRKPRDASKDMPVLDIAVQKKVDAVIDTLNKIKQDVMSNPKACFHPEPEDVLAIVKLLEQEPTPRYVRMVFADMWNEKNRDGTCFWRKKMKIHNVCKEYETRLMGLIGKAPTLAPDERPQTALERAGYEDYTHKGADMPLRFKKLAGAR